MNIEHGVNEMEDLRDLNALENPCTTRETTQWGGGALSSDYVSKLGSKEVRKKLCNFTLAEGATHVDTCDGKRKIAFTLAEVLITLGIIGVVAALTLPSIVHNVQKVVLKNQFKRAYSNFYNAIKYVQVQNGAPYACYYWDKNPYGYDVCVKRNDYGTCVDWTLVGGAQIPNDYNGKNSDCKNFTKDLMKALNVVKFCENNALANGCVTDKFRGVDKILAEQNPDKEADPNQIYSDTNVKQKYPAFITADGVLYSRYASMGDLPVFMVDVNGHKGPNKWGYDIFSFTINGDEVNGITKIRPQNYAVEKGGMTINEILSGKK